MSPNFKVEICLHKKTLQLLNRWKTAKQIQYFSKSSVAKQIVINSAYVF